MRSMNTPIGAVLWDVQHHLCMRLGGPIRLHISMKSTLGCSRTRGIRVSSENMCATQSYVSGASSDVSENTCRTDGDPTPHLTM